MTIDIDDVIVEAINRGDYMALYAIASQLGGGSNEEMSDNLRHTADKIKKQAEDELEANS